jgi:excisionase family DNA binding protein
MNSVIIRYMNSFYTAKELASLAGCAHITIQKWIEKKKLPSFRQGTVGRARTGRHIILAADGERFVAKYRARKRVVVS